MRVTFPHMGNIWIIVKTVLEDLGLEVLVPPRPNPKSLEAGVRHSPEFACFPLKLNIGDFVGALDQGAEAIVMAGGIGPCRLGHYAQVEAQVLKDLGYSAEMVVLEPPRGRFPQLWDKIRYLTGHRPVGRVIGALRFGWEKLKALDELDKVLALGRPAEAVRGSAAAAHRRAVASVCQAASIAGTRKAARAGAEDIALTAGASSGSVTLGPPRSRPLRVGVVGEVFMIQEPFANQEVERRLGEMGVETRRALYLSDWVRMHLLPPPVGLGARRRVRRIREAARPYLRHFVGGEGLDSVGEAVLHESELYDGVIHIAPFTCMPEIVAASLLPEVSRDLGIPVLSLFLDEHTGEAGLVTRLEAFVDLLERRRAVREGRADRQGIRLRGDAPAGGHGGHPVASRPSSPTPREAHGCPLVGFSGWRRGPR